MGFKFCDYFGFRDTRPRLKEFEENDINIVEDNSKISGKISTSKCVAEWVGVKPEPFVYLALKPSLQKNWLRMKRYTFNFTKCDQIFDILLQEEHIRLSDHHVIPSCEELKGHSYCK